jgi:hypothetical protein
MKSLEDIKIRIVANSYGTGVSNFVDHCENTECQDCKFDPSCDPLLEYMEDVLLDTSFTYQAATDVLDALKSEFPDEVALRADYPELFL